MICKTIALKYDVLGFYYFNFYLFLRSAVPFCLISFQFLPSRKITSVSSFFRPAFLFEFLTAVMESLWYKPPGSAGLIDIFNPFIWIEFPSSCQTLLKFCRKAFEILSSFPDLTLALFQSSGFLFLLGICPGFPSIFVKKPLLLELKAEPCMWLCCHAGAGGARCWEI